MKKKQKKYSLTFDQILEIAACIQDCDLTPDETVRYIKSFLRDLKK